MNAAPQRQIVAIGGAGFAAAPRTLTLDRYLLHLTGKDHPAVGFVGTATGDSDLYVAKFYSAYAELGARPSHLPLFARTPDPREFLMRQDIVYVGGGNTRSMLAVWREWGVAEILREAWQAGVLLAGISAGAICWFRQCVTDSWADRLRPLDGLGFLPGSCCPHYDGEAERRPTLHGLLRDGSLIPGVAIEDGAALHYVGESLHRAVAWRDGAQAYRVEVRDGIVHEEPIAAEFLAAG